jgi:hypothetical protein
VTPCTQRCPAQTSSSRETLTLVEERVDDVAAGKYKGACQEGCDQHVASVPSSVPLQAGRFGVFKVNLCVAGA